MIKKVFKITKKGFCKSWATPLSEKDPELSNLIKLETLRQKESIDLIASENFAPQSVLDALGSPLQNKYSEGQPHKRYYGGNDIIDQVEELAQNRARETFGLKKEDWTVNVQAYSGAPANIYTYAALLQQGDHALGLKLSHGGHLSHGFFLPKKKVHWTSKLYNWDHYELGEDYLLDYDDIEKKVLSHKPKLVVAGYSAYSRHYDYKRMREICDKVGAILMSDMAHISGLVAAGLSPDPFKYSHVVTTTTHKTLRGPRGAIIFACNDFNGRNLGKEIEDTVFPGIQGGPHNHTIAAIASCLKDAQTEEFKNYQKQVIANSKYMCSKLIQLGYEIVTNGTENHMVLLNLRNKGIDGARVEFVFNALNITANKNTLVGDLKALKPHGMRFGSPAMTTRGCKEEEFDEICHFIDRGVKLCLKYNGVKRLDKFKVKIGEVMESDEEFVRLREDVKRFASKQEFSYK